MAIDGCGGWYSLGLLAKKYDLALVVFVVGRLMVITKEFA
jgi:hypothetical protein